MDAKNTPQGVVIASDFTRIAEKRRPGISVDIDGVTITKNAIRQTVPWTGIKRIAAFRQDIYLGVVVCLAIEIEDGTTVHVIEGDPAWLDLMQKLNKELPTALGKEKWFLDLATGRQEVVLIYHRTEAAVPVTAQ